MRVVSHLFENSKMEVKFVPIDLSEIEKQIQLEYFPTDFSTTKLVGHWIDLLREWEVPNSQPELSYKRANMYRWLQKMAERNDIREPFNLLPVSWPRGAPPGCHYDVLQSLTMPFQIQDRIDATGLPTTTTTMHIQRKTIEEK